MAVGVLGGCQLAPREALARYAGVSPCAPAAVRYLESPYDDLLRLEVAEPPTGCAPGLPSSVSEVSTGCASLLAGGGACSYSYAHRNVAVTPHRPRGGAGGAVYVVEIN